MPFEGTALRRRPQRFEDLIGQEFVSATLQKSIEAGKIAHAYLFSGPRGCGKTTSARILAKALNCEKGPLPTPCGECTACTEIARGASLDVIEIDGASNTSVNDVRQIKDEILFPPNACRYKIYIIDEVHMLSMSAFNALLKTIEEPPPYVIFIFATTELHKVPTTIKSRCQQFNFRLVPVELVKGALEQAAAESGIEAESEALYWIARQGGGSVRDSYMLFDQVAAFSGERMTFAKIQEKLKITGFDEINVLVEACAKKEPAAALSILDGILQAGVSVEQTISDFADYFRNLLFVKAGITKESILGQSPERFSREVLSAWGISQAEKALEIMLNLYRDARYSLDARCELELSVSRLCWLSDLVTPEELKNAFRAARDIIGQGGRAAGAISPVTAGLATASGAAREPARVSASAPAPRQVERPWGFSALVSAKEAQTPSRNEQGAEREAAPPAGLAPQARPAGFAGAGKAASAAVSPSELPKMLEERFSRANSMLSAIFRQTSGWKKSGSEVSFSVSNAFHLKRMEDEKGEIQKALQEILGEEVSLSIAREDAPESPTAPAAALPPEVEAVCNVFRGNVLSQTAATKQERQAEQEDESNEDTEET